MYVPLVKLVNPCDWPKTKIVQEALVVQKFGVALAKTVNT